MDGMFSMLTADAAANHGHEFSRRATLPANGQRQFGFRPQLLPPRQRRSPLQGGLIRASTGARPHGPTPLGPARRLSAPVRSQSVRGLSVKEEEEVRGSRVSSEMDVRHALLKPELPGTLQDAEEELRQMDTSFKRYSIPGAFIESTVDLNAGLKSPSPIQKQPSPIPSPQSAPETPTPMTLEKQKTTPVPKSHYRFGHPPSTKVGGILRPRVLLQLQEKTVSGFHKPLYDIAPGSRFSSKTRVGQKLRKLKKIKDDQASADDLVVIRPDATEDAEIVGTIQPAGASSAWITVDDGSLWKATLDAKGSSYTIQSLVDPQRRVRWYVPKAMRQPTTGTREFRFSTLIPDSKQHPVLASMSQAGLNVQQSVKWESMIRETDEGTRRLIIISAAWVFFCEGWSPHYDCKSATASSRPPSIRSRGREASCDFFSAATASNPGSRQPSMVGSDSTAEDALLALEKRSTAGSSTLISNEEKKSRRHSWGPGALLTRLRSHQSTRKELCMRDTVVEAETPFFENLEDNPAVELAQKIEKPPVVSFMEPMVVTEVGKMAAREVTIREVAETPGIENDDEPMTTSVVGLARMGSERKVASDFERRRERVTPAVTAKAPTVPATLLERMKPLPHPPRTTEKRSVSPLSRSHPAEAQAAAIPSPSSEEMNAAPWWQTYDNMISRWDTKTPRDVFQLSTQKSVYFPGL